MRVDESRRHCERSEAIQSPHVRLLDGFALLAMTCWRFTRSVTDEGVSTGVMLTQAPSPVWLRQPASPASAGEGRTRGRLT